MSVSRQDIFGRADTAQPALPGSYGEAPPAYRLPASLSLGPVRLAVSDLDRSGEWYATTLGLRALTRDAHGVTLGAADGTPLVHLEAQPGVRPIRPGSRLGLYHFALLLPSRAALGRFVQHLGRIGARAGASDHLVSEAIYLQDPDGLGIEVYADRPRSEWQRLGRELLMASDPLDIPRVVAEARHEPWQGMPDGTVMGHLHLHVGDLGAASAFYSRALGFDRMVWRYPGALFLAAGGYHHHLGVNTWAAQAPSPGEREARLLEWTIRLPSPDDASAARAAVSEAGHAVEGERVSDPWGTTVRVMGGGD